MKSDLHYIHAVEHVLAQCFGSNTHTSSTLAENLGKKSS